MLALYIFIAVLLLLVAAIMLPSTLRISYSDKLKVELRICGLKIKQYPKKKKKIKISNYTKKKIEKRRKKALRKKLKLAKKQNNSRPALKKQSQKGGIEGVLDSIKELLTVLLEKSYRRLKIKATKLHISVGSDDAAKTALLYAAVNGAVVSIAAILDNQRKFKKLKSSDILVSADFLSEKCTAEIDISFSLRAWQMAEIMFAAAFKYSTQKLMK